MNTRSSSLVSIILPTLNSEKYIHQCLMYLYKQSYKNIEIIIIDGGSKDNTKNIINNFKLKLKILFFELQTKNLAQALNFGIKKSKGEFVARLDSDDLISKNRLIKQINFLKSNRDYDIVGTHALRIYTNSFFSNLF